MVAVVPVKFRNSASGCVLTIPSRIEARCIQCAGESIVAKAATRILESKNSSRRVGLCRLGEGVTETENPKTQNAPRPSGEIAKI